MRWWALLVVGWLGGAPADVRFPADAGVVDVRAHYGARGDGVTDDTDALQRALNEHAGKGLIYLPHGTYRISATLTWMGRATRNILQGQSAAGTVIRLADRCHGFGDPSQPRPLVHTGLFPPQRFRNAIRDLTLDTGQGNPGAIGCRFNASNQGQINSVTIRSGDGSGPIGLDMGYTSDVGPLWVKALRVVGFEVGVYTAHGVAGQAMEDILLEGQRQCGWVNDGQAVSVHRLRTRGQPLAVWNKGLFGHLVILDAELEGAGEHAIRNDASLYARDIRARGYGRAIGGCRGVPGQALAEFVSHPAQSLHASPARSLHLPIVDPPSVPWDDPATWVSLTKYQPTKGTIYKERRAKDGTVTKVPVPVDDWTQALQQAIDSGATTVYCPRPGGYEVLGTVHLRGKLRRLIGMEASFGSQGHGTLQLDDGESPVVVIERCDWIYAPLTVRTASRRTLVVNAVAGAKYDIGPGSRVFLDDVVTLLRIGRGAQVWVRQFNTEYTEQHSANWYPDQDRWERPGNLNDGGRLWVLGLKTEGDGTLITTRGGGQTEVLGGVVYANKNYHPAKKMFVNDGSSLAVSVREFVSRDQPFNPVVETRAGATRTLPPTPGGALLTLFTGYAAPPGDPPPPAIVAPTAAAPGAPLPAGDGTGLRLARSGGLVSWTGQLVPRVSGLHMFWVDAERSRLLIGGETVVSAWAEGVRYRFGAVALEAGRRYAVKLECAPPATATAMPTAMPTALPMRWQYPGAKAEPVPTRQLFPAASAAPQVTLTVAAANLAAGARTELLLTRDGDLAAPLTVRLAPSVDLAPLLRLQFAGRGDAVEGRDYEPLLAAIAFAAGQASVSVPLVTRDSGRPEPARRLALELAGAADYDAASPRVTVTIAGAHLPPPGTGTGLTGDYFHDTNLTQPAGRRLDRAIDFRWDLAKPLPVIEPNRKPPGYGVRWTGQVQAQYSERYRFEVEISKYGGARLWLDGKLVIDAWGENPLRRGTVELQAGRRHDLKLEWAHRNFYDGRIRLLWSSPSQFEQVVPTTQLHPAP